MPGKRATWKGWLKLDELVCPVALYTASSTSERIVLHTINPATGHRARREFVDSRTGKPVPREEQVKGFEIAPDEYLEFEEDEIAALVPEGDKTLNITAFVPVSEVDTLYLDNPYYLTPSSPAGEEVFALIRDGLRAQNAAAIARAVLFRRVRSVLIHPDRQGLIADTLNFDYEVRPAEAAFDDLPEIKVEGEMLDLAQHIINTKAGSFDPSTFDDRYEEALAEMVRAKLEGRKLKPMRARKPEKVVDLLSALRESAAMAKKPAPSRRRAG